MGQQSDGDGGGLWFTARARISCCKNSDRGKEKRKPFLILFLRAIKIEIALLLPARAPFFHSPRWDHPRKKGERRRKSRRKRGKKSVKAANLLLCVSAAVAVPFYFFAEHMARREKKNQWGHFRRRRANGVRFSYCCVCHRKVSENGNKSKSEGREKMRGLTNAALGPDFLQFEDMHTSAQVSQAFENKS